MTSPFSLFRDHPGETALVAASGLLLTAAFPKVGLDPLAWVALVPLLWAVRKAPPKTAFWLGLVFGIFHNASLLYWIEGVVRVYGYLPVYISVPALAMLTLYMSLYPAIAAGVLRSAVSRPGWVAVAFPVLWVAGDYARTYLLSGFPWEFVGYSQYQRLSVIQIADLAGVYGVTGLLVAANSAIFLVVLTLAGRRWGNVVPDKKHVGVPIGAVAVLVAASLGYGMVKAGGPVAGDHPATASVTVVQGNIEQGLKWDKTFVEETVSRYVNLSLAAGGNSDLVVWPETALPFYFPQDTKNSRRVIRAIQKTGAWFLVGSPAYAMKNGGHRFYNAAFMISPLGDAAGRYDKVHLVPYGEYVPLRRFFPFLGKLVEHVGDFTRGKKGHTLDWAKGSVGVMICYEIIFPDLARKQAAAGADLLVTITNDAWFGTSSAPYQHFSMSVLRAVENRRSVVRAANTGISGFVAPNGEMLARTDLMESTALTRDVPIMPEKTFYTRRGDVFAILCVLAAFFLVLFYPVRKWITKGKRT
ncbi:MAG: apolipoprotein N-acyltransferase [Desulfatibacillaceae bacterium]